ncbi:dual specificity protein kinase splB-like [Oppia nitens]|uniref:dual specificity protein kinase splB-like n=1 Tax=Oppia nitens TaxID=1686743 RepID=UPI0023DC325E|nr:dual specificity protein kinase splB-like [Oppia nitens]
MMSFKRKDVKKSSYYVWFLGAKESKGLRGDEYVMPVLRLLVDKERHSEPSKVTLQVNNKGIKIVQTVIVANKTQQHQQQRTGSSKGGGGSGGGSVLVATGDYKSSYTSSLFGSIGMGGGGGTGSGTGAVTVPPKTEQIKHLIPNHSITWVSQEEDIICCILLIYNPVTKCPVHVHAYRCDSIETATSLRNQLQILIDRPENQKKFREIEIRLMAKGLMTAAAAANTSLPSLPVPSLPLSLSSATSSALDFLPTPSAAANRRTLNSDGRSTRTDGSDGSDESLSSSSYMMAAYHQQQRHHHLNSNIDNIDCEVKHQQQYHQTKGVSRLNRSYSTVNNNSNNHNNRVNNNNHNNNDSNCHLKSYRNNHNHNNNNNNNNILANSAYNNHNNNSNVSMLYESLAAEFKAKLDNPKSGPILLPPRDYDTISRKRGKLVDMDVRKSTNPTIVGSPNSPQQQQQLSPHSTAPGSVNTRNTGGTRSSLMRCESSAAAVAAAVNHRPLAVRRSYYFDRIDSLK